MRVLGVDGGQSGIRLRDSDAERTVELPGISRGEDDPIAALADAVARGWRDGGFGVPDRVMLGLSTAPAATADADRLADAVAAATQAREVWLADDAVTAHAGALGLAPGVSVVVGTGVATLALPEGGPARILGGHGFLLGDEGGAFWIGARGIGAVLRAEEGRGEPTTLAAAAAARYGDLAELHVRLHDARRPVDAIARFAPDVVAAAAAGDAVADAIVEGATAELVALVRSASAVVRLDRHGVRVALGGRLLDGAVPFRTRLVSALARDLPSVTVVASAGTPLDGALRIAAAPSHPYGSLIHVWNRGGT